MKKFNTLCEKIKGFTLSEALVTIGIIGAIAAIGLPVLMQGTDNAETAAKVRKAYEVLSQGYYSVVAENKGLPMNMWSGDVCTNIFADMKGSFSENEFTTSDGIRYNCSVDESVSIVVDVNGAKGPNTDGEDRFSFVSENNTLVPNGNNATGFEACKTANGNSTECTGWVIKYGNLNYLNCASDLSWDGTYTCP